MDKQSIYDLIEKCGFWRVITEHEPVYNMEEAGRLALPYPESDAKNLFVRDNKKRNYYLISVKGDKRVNLKAFREKHGTRSLTFASDTDLMRYLGVEPGAVTPLGLLNDKDCTVKLFIDSDLCGENGIISVHPCDNSATVCMKTADLISLLRERGTEVEITDF